MAEEAMRWMLRLSGWLADRIVVASPACVALVALLACGRENVCPANIAFVKPSDEVSIEWGPSRRYGLAASIDSGSAACIAEFTPAVHSKNESVEAFTGYHLAVTVHIHTLKGDSAGYESLFLAGGPRASLRIEALDDKGTIIDTGRADIHLGRGVDHTSIAGSIGGLGPDAVRQIRSVRARWLYQ